MLINAEKDDSTFENDEKSGNIMTKESVQYMRKRVIFNVYTVQKEKLQKNHR